ncbi:MAG: hypothetical protein KA210_12800 [Bacteroidia bacterium]|nr:hypothetical protein [Bacteroidia bacterium]
MKKIAYLLSILFLYGCPKTRTQQQLLTESLWRLTSKTEIKDSANVTEIIRGCDMDDRIQYFTNGKVEYTNGYMACNSDEKTNQKEQFNWKFGDSLKNTLIETKIVNGTIKTTVKNIEVLSFRSLITSTFLQIENKQVEIREYYKN